MPEIINAFTCSMSPLQTLSKKISTYTTKCEAMQKMVADMDHLCKEIQKLTQDFDAGQAELAILRQRVQVLEEQCSKSLEETKVKGEVYSQLVQEP